MINAFFGFTTEPFTKEIETKNLFITESVKELLSRLDYIKNNPGLMLLTGESGTGKTIALRAFVEKLNTSFYLPLYIPLTTISVIEFYRQLNFKLTGEFTGRKVDMFYSIQGSVKDYVANHKKVPVIIIDEAHLLRPDTLCEIPILLNFDIDSVNPLVFILAGQPYLREKISRPIHTSLNQRFLLKYNIGFMNKSETAAYIEHRLKICGCDRNIFSASAIEAVYQNSNGLTRVIDSICRKAIACAAAGKKETITEEEIFTAGKET